MDKHKHAANDVDKIIIFSSRRSQSLHFFVSSTIVIVGFFVLDVPILFVVVVGRRRTQSVLLQLYARRRRISNSLQPVATVASLYRPHPSLLRHPRILAFSRRSRVIALLVPFFCPTRVVLVPSLSTCSLVIVRYFTTWCLNDDNRCQACCSLISSSFNVSASACSRCCANLAAASTFSCASNAFFVYTMASFESRPPSKTPGAPSTESSSPPVSSAPSLASIARHRPTYSPRRRLSRLGLYTTSACRASSRNTPYLGTIYPSSSPIVSRWSIVASFLRRWYLYRALTPLSSYRPPPSSYTTRTLDS